MANKPPNPPADRLHLLADRLQLLADHLHLLADRLQLLADRLQVLADRLQVLADHLHLPADHLQLPADHLQLPADRLQLLANRLHLVADGLKGKAPEDLQKFLTTATASYGAGRKAPYTAKLTLRGYSPAAIDGELLGLKGVANFSKAQATAKGAASKATDGRDAAAKALQGWIGEFRKVARRTLRTRPDLLSALEL